MAVDEDEKAVPVVVRLGVLTMFPLIEALGQLKVRPPCSLPF
jgi:hypothetical protein